MALLNLETISQIIKLKIQLKDKLIRHIPRINRVINFNVIE